ncbi:MAG TPA: hypothetical protein VK619_12105 [Pyrinomonadaceae bacterium]|nr:hypothetical protein [Pyrinomonadaceae bacterium]
MLTVFLGCLAALFYVRVKWANRRERIHERDKFKWRGLYMQERKLREAERATCQSLQIDSEWPDTIDDKINAIGGKGT